MVATPVFVSVYVTELVPDVSEEVAVLKLPVALLEVQVMVPVGLDPVIVAVHCVAEFAGIVVGVQVTVVEDWVFDCVCFWKVICWLMLAPLTVAVPEEVDVVYPLGGEIDHGYCAFEVTGNDMEVEADVAVWPLKLTLQSTPVAKPLSVNITDADTCWFSLKLAVIVPAPFTVAVVDCWDGFAIEIAVDELLHPWNE